MSRPDVNIFASYPKFKKNEVFKSISYRDMEKFFERVEFQVPTYAQFFRVTL